MRVLSRAGWPVRPGRSILYAALGLVLAGTLAPATLGQQLPADFHTVRDVPLPGDTSRFDYESVDSQTHRLCVTHLGAGTIAVDDFHAGSIVGEVRDVPGVHGVLALPDLGRVYATATSSNQVAVIDPQTLSVTATIPGGVYPDGLAYDPGVGKLYVSDETGGTDTVIDTSSNQVVTTVPLGGEVGNILCDPVSHQIVVAVQTRNQTVTIDPQSDQASGRYDTPCCDHPHGVQISPDRRMALIACEANARLVVMDLQSMTIAESHDVGTVPDVLAFDARRRVLFVAAESGPLTAFFETGTGLKLLAQRDVGPNAHAVAVDPDTGHTCTCLLLTSVANPVLREISVAAPAGDDTD